MLIGIKYNSVFPEPVFTTPEGLTLYKSKFLPPKDGELGCVGGPSRALKGLMDHMGTNHMISLFTWLAENENYFQKNLEYQKRAVTKFPFA